MNKIIKTLLAICLLLTVSACGNNKQPEPEQEVQKNEMAKLFEEGYSCNSSTYMDNSWHGMFIKDNDYSSTYKVEATLTDEKRTELEEIDFFDEGADKKTQAVLETLTDVVITDISDMVPSQEDLDQYIGKTIGDLENDGFENSGYFQDENTYNFYYDGPVYGCLVYLKEGTEILDIDDYSANDIRELEIGHLEFQYLSSRIIDFE